MTAASSAAVAAAADHLTRFGKHIPDEWKVAFAESISDLVLACAEDAQLYLQQSIDKTLNAKEAV